jgi:hypothetical protein
LGKNTTAIVIAGIVALAAGLGIGLLMNRSGGDGADDAAMARVLERLEALESGSADPGNPRAAGTASSAAAAHWNAMKKSSGLASSTDKPSLTPAQMQANREARVRALEARFAQEPQDPAAATAEIDMLKAMDDKLLATTGTVAGNPDVECRRDSCRVTADFRNSDEATEWALHYVTLLGGGTVKNAQPLVVRKPDGTVQMRMYAARGGS